jgi:2-polyprenyl-3-methyl-5-hydroxy-6-metoxy-1,4-benzoquinol methylase
MEADHSTGITTWNCDLCGSDDFIHIDVARRYIGEDQEPPVVCARCGFVYVRERRTSAEIAKAWDDIWGEGYTSAWPAVKARLTYVAEYMRQTIPGKHLDLLDVGAGEGDFLKIVAGSHFLASGLEPSAENCRKINLHGFPANCGTLETFEPNKQYDVITLLWTLENTGDGVGILLKAHSLLKPGGRIVVATGSRIGVPFKKPLHTYFSRNPQDLHCFRFSANSLASALYGAGFDNMIFNRFDDSDWLVVIGTAVGREKLCGAWRDDYAKVIQFFNDWDRMFP